MATLLNLVEQNRVFKLDAGLGSNIWEERRFFVLPRVRNWLDETLSVLASNWNLELTPIEQLAAFLEDYCSGETLMFERQFRPLLHIDKGIWELKTADLRLFGWFHVKDCFIGTACDTAQRVKDHNLYRGYRDEAVRLRDELDLDEPKFVKGDDPNDVVSAFCFP